MANEPVDPNNPQREEVLRREREMFERNEYIRMRVSAILSDAAAVALIPGGARIGPDAFTALARHVYTTTRENLDQAVDNAVTTRQFSLSGTPTNEETKS